jgi:hypothetical protein
LEVHGAAWLQTMASAYTFVNHTVFGLRGTYNPATGETRITFRSLAD